MANKSLGTRQKMVFRLPQSQPQNPFAISARQRKTGPHGKSRGAPRRQANVLLARLLGEMEEEK